MRNNIIKSISCFGLILAMTSLSYAKTMAEDMAMDATSDMAMDAMSDMAMEASSDEAMEAASDMAMEASSDMVMDGTADIGVESSDSDAHVCYVFQNNQLSTKGSCSISNDYRNDGTRSDIKMGSNQYRVEISSCNPAENAEEECKFSLNAKDAELYYRDLAYKEITDQYFTVTAPGQVLTCYRSVDAKIDMCYLD